MKARNKTAAQLIFFILLAIILVLIIDVQFFYQRQFDSVTMDVTASSDPEIIARGEYLVYGPARCADCHGDFNQRKAIAAGEKVALSGGFFEQIILGKIIFPNITPDKETGIGKLSDSEIAYFFRTGINHRGEYGLPFMNYQSVSQSDLIAILSFLRSQKPVRHKVPASSYNFLGKLTLAYFLRPEEPATIFPSDIPQQATLEYGHYLTEALASCRECHTNRSLTTGQYLGDFYKGGMVFEHPDNPQFNVVSPSLIPAANSDKVAGFSKADFVTRMQAGLILPWSPMPWGPYSRMSATDLEAVYLYLYSLNQQD